MPYLKKDYKLVKIERSSNPKKKYDAILENKDNGRIKRMSFGSRPMEQYRDSTKLKLYKSKDHLDKNRKKAFLDRFRKLRERQDWNKEWTSLYFATKYLWS